VKRTKNRTPWKQNFESVDVGDRLRLVPFWERGLHSTDRVELIIDPGPSFGLGNHPTTIMALEFLEEIAQGVQPGFSLLDVGTGTGILSIAGKLLGADEIVAHDIEEFAVVMTRRNFKINFNESDLLVNTSLFVGEINAVRHKFDIVVANLIGPVLLKIKRSIISVASDKLILSGIADPYYDKVKSVFSESFILVREKNNDGWHSMVLEK
jgi:ribosomal protein L11 methyltransferase